MKKANWLMVSAFALAITGAFAFKTSHGTKELAPNAYKITDCTGVNVTNCTLVTSSTRCTFGGVDVENEFDDPGCSGDLYQH